jgi:hypothetical protein
VGEGGTHPDGAAPVTGFGGFGGVPGQRAVADGRRRGLTPSREGDEG